MVIRKLTLVLALLYAPTVLFSQNKKEEKPCSDACCRKGSSSTTKPKKMTPKGDHRRIMACKLTTPELQKRKIQVIASLKAKVIKRKELKSGFSYLFAANDGSIDEVTAFIKTERMCCDFFNFNMSVQENDLWLTITGEAGVKEFITNEIGL